MTQLEQELKALIIESLNLSDLSIDDIDSQAPLFVDGLGLDSIDALELGIAIKKKYKLSMSTDASENQRHFTSVATLAQFINSNLKSN